MTREPFINVIVFSKISFDWFSAVQKKSSRNSVKNGTFAVILTKNQKPSHEEICLPVYLVANTTGAGGKK